MPEKKQTQQINAILSAYQSAESRLSQVSRRNLILLAAGIGILFLAVGALLGFAFSPYRQVATPDSDLTDTCGDGETSLTGIVRALDEPQNESRFYLEIGDGSQVLLRSSRIDLTAMESSSVEAEGVLVGCPEGPAGTSDAVLFISKIFLKTE